MSQRGLKNAKLSAIWGGLRARLFLLILLAVVPALGLNMIAYAEQRNRAVSDVQANALRLTRMVASEYESRVENARTLLIALSRLPEVHGRGAEACVACGELFADLLRQYPQYASLGAADLSGQVFCSGQRMVEPVSIAHRSFFQQVVQTGDLAYREYQMGSLTQKAVLSIGYPIIDEDGVVEGVVFVELDLSWLDGFMLEARPPADSTLCLLDKEGRILVHSPAIAGVIGQSMPDADIMSCITSAGEGVTDAAGIDGIPRLHSFVRLDNSTDGPLYVSIGIPTATAFAETNRILGRNLAAFGLVAVAAIIAAWAGGGFFIVRPVDALLSMTRRIASGDLRARAGLRSGGGELQQLAHAFDQMAEKLEQRDVERKNAEERIRRQATRAEALARVAGRLNAELDLESVLHAVCEDTSRALNVPAALVSLYAEDKEMLYCGTEDGLSPGFCDQLSPIPRDRFEAYAQAQGNPFVIADVDAGDNLFDSSMLSAMEAHQVAAAGMLREHQLVGVLCVVASDESRQFSQDDLMLLKGLANQAAQAITNARLYALLKQEGQTKANLIHKIITAQEDERNRIARELHDQTVQDVTLLMMNLDLSRMHDTRDGGAGDKHWRRSRNIAEETLDNLRRIIGDLRPSELDDLGLGPAIAWYGDHRLKPLGLCLELAGNALDRRLPQVMETALFRIAQEALTNTVKHSGAWMASVHLDVVGSHVVMEVQDDGQGFEARAAGTVQANGGGLGLSGMRERATLLGGEFCLHTAPGQGTKITVELPLSEEESNV